MKVVHQKNGWQLLVDSQPYIVRGVGYTADKVGEDPNQGNLRDWMVVDDDHDGRIDVAYQSWVDANHNNRKDANEPEVGDFKLMADMGVNTIRIYHHASENPEIQKLYPTGGEGDLIYNHPPNKKLLRDLFEKYGIRVAMGDELGAYAVGSGADWSAGTDYLNDEQKANMRASVEDMVKEFKDEPYLLMWILGNENNYNMTHTNANTHAKEYAQFVNEIAQLIHKLDGHHPVVLCNGEIQPIHVYAKYAPDVDIYGMNVYRRPGFGFLWHDVDVDYGKPVLITEFGVTRPKFTNGKFDEKYQADEMRSNWCDIERHTAGGDLPQNALGGFVYTWLDNWWQDGNPRELFAVPGRWNHEMLGLMSQGDGRHSPLLRQPRESYRMFQRLWKTHQDQCTAPAGSNPS